MVPLKMQMEWKVLVTHISQEEKQNGVSLDHSINVSCRYLVYFVLGDLDQRGRFTTDLSFNMDN